MKPGQKAGFCHSAHCLAGALLCGLNGRGSLQKGKAGLRQGTAGPKGLTLSAYKSNTRQIKKHPHFPANVLFHVYCYCTVAQLK